MENPARGLTNPTRRAIFAVFRSCVYGTFPVSDLDDRWCSGKPLDTCDSFELLCESPSLETRLNHSCRWTPRFCVEPGAIEVWRLVREQHVQVVRLDVSQIRRVGPAISNNNKKEFEKAQTCFQHSPSLSLSLSLSSGPSFPCREREGRFSLLDTTETVFSKSPVFLGTWKRDPTLDYVSWDAAALEDVCGFFLVAPCPL